MGWIRSFAALLPVLSLLSAASAAEPESPVLDVVKLKPADGSPAAPTPAAAKLTDADQEVLSALAVISDKSVDQASKNSAFGRIVGMDEQAIARLEAVLRDGNARFDQRWVSARALGKIGGKPAIKILRSVLETDKFSMIRLAAIEALKDLNDPGSFDDFVKCLTDDALVVRSAAADALGTLGDARAVDPLTKALDREDNFYKGRSLWVRRHIVAALGSIESRSSVKVLIKALDDVDPAVKGEAVSALERVTKVTFRVPASTEDERISKTLPKWKSWWQENKKDYL